MYGVGCIRIYLFIFTKLSWFVEFTRLIMIAYMHRYNTWSVYCIYKPFALKTKAEK